MHVARRRRCSRIGSSLSIAFVLSPRISNSTSAACRPFAIWPALAGSSGERTFWTAATLARRVDDVLDGRVEGRRARSKRAALDQHALTRGHLEPRIEDPVHAARLAGTRLRRVGLLRADLAADGEREQHQREPAERGGLPVSGAPAADAGREVRAALCRARTASRLTPVFHAPGRSSWQLLCRGIIVSVNLLQARGRGYGPSRFPAVSLAGVFGCVWTHTRSQPRNQRRVGSMRSVLAASLRQRAGRRSSVGSS